MDIHDVNGHACGAENRLKTETYASGNVGFNGSFNIDFSVVMIIPIAVMTDGKYSMYLGHVFKSYMLTRAVKKKATGHVSLKWMLRS